MSILKTLNKLKPGQKAFIVDIRNTKLCERFFEIGIFPGDMVEVEENDFGNNIIIVKINNNTFTIFREAAEAIMTNQASLAFALN